MWEEEKRMGAARGWVGAGAEASPSGVFEALIAAREAAERGSGGGGGGRPGCADSRRLASSTLNARAQEMERSHGVCAVGGSAGGRRSGGAARRQ